MPLDLGAMGSTPPAPTNVAGLAAAEAEEERYYTSDKKKREHRREQNSKDVVHYGFISILITAGLCVVSGLVIWTLHQILPPKDLWLDDAHVNNLAEAGKLILSGSIGALGSKFLTRNIEP